MKQIKVPEIEAHEFNIGLINYQDGSEPQWIILTADLEGAIDYTDAMHHAELNDFSLPTASQMSFLRAAARVLFKDCFYWCVEEEDKYSAMTTYMRNGNQIFQNKRMKLRACFIRKINVEYS